jgi:hydrogenase maturation protease
VNNVKVIGVGSPFGNDSIGWEVIEKLVQQQSLMPLLFNRVELIKADRPGINIIQAFKNAEFVILIDAFFDKDKPGTVLRLNKNQLVTAQPSFSSHDFGVADAIQLAEKLNMLPEILLIFGLGIDGQQLDSQIKESVAELADTVRRELVDYFKQPAII